MALQRKFMVHSVDETRELAEKLAGKLTPDTVLTLEGDLGAGKTTFTKALAKALGVEGTVNSPTFTIMKEYVGTMPFYHMDAYRIEDEGEDFGLDEYFNGGGVTVIEWPSMIQSQLPSSRIDMTIIYRGPDTREIVLVGYGRDYIQVVKELSGK